MENYIIKVLIYFITTLNSKSPCIL